MNDLTTPAAVLEAEQLLELMEKQDPAFVPKFYAADRAVVGALLGYVHQAVHALSKIEGDSPADVRRWLRATVVEVVGQLEEEG